MAEKKPEEITIFQQILREVGNMERDMRAEVGAKMVSQPAAQKVLDHCIACLVQAQMAQMLGETAFAKMQEAQSAITPVPGRLLTPPWKRN